MSPATATQQQHVILELLRRSNALDQQDIPEVRERLSTHDETVEEALVGTGVVTEEAIAAAYADYLMLPTWSLEEAQEDLANPDDLASILPEKVCRENLVVPVRRTDSTLCVAAVNPTDLDLFESLQLIAGIRVDVFAAALSDVTGVLDTLYGARDVVRELATQAHAEEEASEEEIELDDVALDLHKSVDGSREGQIVSIVNHVLIQAVERGASDIHLEPFEDCVRIRLRVDGGLMELTPPPRSMFIPMISRLKILARMDIAEKRIPQDGAFSMQHKNSKIDLRVSTIPGVWGEKMVMRLLNKKAIPLDMSRLGFSQKQAEDFREAMHSPHGLVFVTGPTGSGKSTTLYTGLNMLNGPERNLVTVEDPVEYRFTGINQIQVKPQVGLTFASALRSFLRQDPDVIMVGEVRDQETAEICLRAALTGHLVLSTLHTNDALSAISRLQDMGIEAFLLSATLRLIQAQRLLRRLCPECKTPIAVDENTRRTLALSGDETFYGPAGCGACNGRGYKGRLGIFEVLGISPQLRDLIQANATWKELHTATRAEGVDLLAESGIRKARAGMTSLEEVMAVALAGEE
jgi:type IV pilus assembly protein PilB